jgi:hypothetical protein
MLLTSIVDPDSFESGSGSFQVNPDPLPDPVFGSRVLMTKNLKNTAEENYLILIKN